MSMGDGLGPKYCNRYRGEVDLLSWSVREVLLYIYAD